MLATTPSSREARDVVGMDDLDVGDVMPMIAGAVGPHRRLDDIQRQAHGRVADRVEVGLEATPIELDDGPAKQIGIEERHAGLSVVTDVGRRHQRGP